MQEKAKTRDTLIGQFFLKLDEGGKPAQAGVIRGKAANSEYVVEVTFDPLKSRHGRLVTTEVMRDEDWALYQSSSMWRQAFDIAMVR